MSSEAKPSRRISRRGFIKAGCAGAAAVGATVCGVSLARPEPPPIDLKAYTYGEDHEKRILIAYASATGSTAEVAAEIGKTISEIGYRVEVEPIREKPALNSFDAVLLGSAVYYSNWLPEAVEFVQVNQEALKRVPVAVFTVHIQNLGDEDPSRRNRLAYLNEIRPLLQPVDEAFFAGRFDRRGAKIMFPGLIARFVPTMDLRDWEKILSWAQSVHPLLYQSAIHRGV